MSANQIRLGWAVLATVAASAILVLAGVITGTISFLYRGVAAITTAHSLLQIAGGASGAVLLVTAVSIFIPIALKPGGWGRRFLHVLPILCMGIALVGVVLTFAGIGSGAFAGGWLGGGAALTAISLLVVVFRSRLSERTIRAALSGISIAAAINAIGWVAMVALLGLVLANPVTFPQRGAFDGGAPGGAGGFPGGAPGEGRPGGGGEGASRLLGPGSFQTVLIVGAVLMAILGVVMIIACLRAWRTLRIQPSPAVQGPIPGGAREAGSALVALLILAAAFVGVIQLVPVNRTNPPVQTTLQWDTAQTKDLAYRACMDCHSNETRWPWYATIAPGSWLTAMHVNEGRQRLNFSELNNLSADQKSRITEEIAQQIRGGSMPLSDYLLIHPDANLTDAEKQALIQGFQASLAK